VLSRLARRVALVVIITGRPARTLVDLAGLTALAGLPVLVLGAYGSESWDARTDRYVVPDPGPQVAAARTHLTRLLANAPPGTWLEDKHRALAVHTRRTRDPAGVQATLEPAVRAVADELGLRFEPGRAVLEVREPGGDKGDALRAAVARSGARAVLYCGDDLGDLPAFETAGDLRQAGVSVLRVGVASTERHWSPGIVDAQVDGPEGVLTLLRALLPPDAG
jgi:trehalose 6-phosphate phosphatase